MAYSDAVNATIEPMQPVRVTSLSITNGATYRGAAFAANGGVKLGVAIRANQALTVGLAYGRMGTDAAATAGVGTSAALPAMTATQSFASADSAEGGTYKEFDIPPQASLAQLVITNSSGSTATVSYLDYCVEESV